MADSTVIEITKMKVVDLRKELKSRGLSHAGDKAELVARLQTAVSQDHADINLDSDEIDSDGVLEDEDDKSQADNMLDDAADEDLALAGQLPTPTEKNSEDSKPTKILKRKLTSEDKDKSVDKGAAAKKIVLNRATSITSMPTKAEEEKADVASIESKSAVDKVKITEVLDPKTRLEMRAKRFGLPVKMSDEERKEARKQRFCNQNSGNTDLKFSSTGSISENLEKLKKRAERFGQSVSKIMTEIEKKEKLEQRKAKFGTVN